MRVNKTEEIIEGLFGIFLCGFTFLFFAFVLYCFIIWNPASTWKLALLYIVFWIPFWGPFLVGTVFCFIHVIKVLLDKPVSPLNLGEGMTDAL